jgi:Ca2+/Na+ antiporter
MATRQQLDMLSFGVFIIIVAILLIAFAPNGQWDRMISLTIALFGIWIIATAGIRARNPSKYERGAYSTFVMGLLLLAVGGAWFINIVSEGNLILSIFVLLIVIGLLAIGTALPTMRKKQ